MDRITTWYRTSPPLVKMLMAVSITSAVVVCHRTLYAPYVRRQRYKRSEEWADMIIDQEERGEETNISY